MADLFNVYCDESCHLEKDSHRAMTLGAVWCPCAQARPIAERIREIKTGHGLSSSFEVKWTKISAAKSRFYLDLLDYFFDNKDLHFRALVVPDKSRLDHNKHSQTHDDWYYKMYFDMLKVIIDPKSRYRIFLDIKDTQGASKVRKLHEVLSNAHYDFARTIIERIQTVRSHEVEILQMADLLIGAVSYANRGLSTNAGKVEIVARMRKRSGYALTRTTLFRENKVNLFRWEPWEGSL